MCVGAAGSRSRSVTHGRPVRVTGSPEMTRISLLLHVRPERCLCAWACTAVLTRGAGARTRSDKQISFDEFCVWWEVSDDHHRPALRHPRPPNGFFDR